MPNGHPIDAGISGPVTAGDDFLLTVTMDGYVATATTITLNASSPDITGPSGSAFPVTAVVFAGHNSVDVPLGTTQTASVANATITASANGASASVTMRVRQAQNTDKPTS